MPSLKTFMFISKIPKGANELYGEEKVHDINIAIDRVIHHKESIANQIIKQVNNMTPNTSLHSYRRILFELFYYQI